MIQRTGALLRSRIGDPDKPLLLPGAPNALTARVIEDLGFEAVYVSGAGIANTFLGSPDVGLVTETELVAHVSAIRDAVALPIIVDADTGFGNAVNMGRTVRDLARAGADAIQIEDQVSPKRCGHFSGKAVIPVGEMVGKVTAAVDARPHEDVLIIARTDARAELGLDEAISRAQRYQAAGADALFVEAPRDETELRRVGESLEGPLVANMVEGGLTPMASSADLGKLGFTMHLYANAAMRAGVLGMQEVLTHLRDTGDTGEVMDRMVSWQERQRLVRKPEHDALDARYGHK